MKIKTLQTLTALLAFVFSGTFLAFASKENHSDKKEFNAGEMIMHHVLDAHEIHFITLGEGTPNEKHISVPLPVILYSKEHGLDIFLSSAFHTSHNAEKTEDSTTSHSEIHGLAKYGPYGLYHEKIYLLNEAGTLDLDEHGHPTNAQPLDFSITKTVFGMLVASFLLVFLFIKASAGYKIRKNQAPKGLQSFLEPLVLFIRDEVAKPSIGHKYERFMPFLLTVFFFILICNLLGLIPFIGGFNITGNIAVTAILAIFTFIITSINGNKAYWLHILWPPGVPVWLYPLLIPIEIMGMFIKPLVLTLRLFANITAGHIIILSFISLIFIFASLFGTGAGLGASILSLAFGIFMNIMEFLVAFLQAYVFTLLSALYFGSAVEEHAHADDHH
jgi:F-type H+-transporting ATPase subunit a